MTTAHTQGEQSHRQRAIEMRERKKKGEKKIEISVSLSLAQFFHPPKHTHTHIHTQAHRITHTHTQAHRITQPLTHVHLSPNNSRIIPKDELKKMSVKVLALALTLPFTHIHARTHTHTFKHIFPHRAGAQGNAEGARGHLRRLLGKVAACRSCARDAAPAQGVIARVYPSRGATRECHT